jgi:hypothetical protein
MTPAKRRARKGRLAVALTSHGYGHATRTLAVLKSLVERQPGLDITVSATVPASLFEGELGETLLLRHQVYEPGTIQKNCFEVDLEGTRDAYREHLARRKGLIAAEKEFLAAGKFDGLLVDVPAIPLAAASGLKIPAAALWNFTWDWILEPLLQPGDVEPPLARLPEQLREDYHAAGLHLRLPFSSPRNDLPGVESAPLVSRRARRTREATHRILGLASDDHRPLVLLAMGGWSCGEWRSIKVQGCSDFRFLVVGDVPVVSASEVRRLPAELSPDLRFSDLVAASDAVLSKPGYGIASECVTHHVPLLGVERRGFREAPELAREMQEFGPFHEISLDDFFAGAWEAPLGRLISDRRGWRETPSDGAQQVADRLLRYFDLG